MLTQTLDREGGAPPTRDGPEAADPEVPEFPEVPEVLIREARRRQRRRRLLVALALVCVGALVAGLTMSAGSPPPRPPSPKHKAHSPTPKPSGRPVTQPVTPPVTSAPPRLVSIAFSSPTSGYGVFEKGSTPFCSVEVAATSDGGAAFAPPVAVAPWCTAQPAVAFDGHGDGVLYSSTTNVAYLTHDAGRSWSAEKQAGKVLSVEALGTSVWMLTVSCPATRPSSTAAVCQLTVRESVDGGRTWRTSAAQPRTSPPVPGAAGGSGELVRVSQTAAYVLGGPNELGSGKLEDVPLWYTDDAGATWTSHALSCGMPALSVFLSAAPTGTLYGVCAGEPGLGNQVRSIVASTDGGASWYHPRGCSHTPALGTLTTKWCVTGFNGYVGGIVAASATTAFIYGDRLGIAEVVGGGGAARYSTSMADVTFFSPSSGIALGLSTRELPAVWHTDDGGRSWSLVAPAVHKSSG